MVAYLMECGLAVAMEDGSVSFPPHKCLPFGTELFPHVLVGDDALALKPYLMKPFPHKNGFTITATAEQEESQKTSLDS